MATIRPFTPSAADHRRIKYTPALHRTGTCTLELREQEAEEMLLQWGLFQTYGIELVEDKAYGLHKPLKTLPERLAGLLISQSADPQESIFGLRFQTIADYLGTSRETIASIMRAFARQGFVAIGYGRIDILDIESMRELADLYEQTLSSDQGKGKDRHRQGTVAAAQ